MKKTWFLFCLIGVLGLYWLWTSRTASHTEHVKGKQGAYFLPIAVTKFTKAGQPCVLLKINDEVASAMLDLGFQGQFGMTSELGLRIQHKKYLGSKKMYGIRSESEEKLYEIPQINVGPMVFSRAIAHECAAQAGGELLLSFQEPPSLPEPARLGWELFGNTNLLLDLRCSRIAFCDHVETLKQHYPNATFLRAPLLLERGLVEFMLTTSTGDLRCMLDTGSTWNILNTDGEEEISCLETKELGLIDFHHVSFQMPIHIEAILGMEFFKTHVVFLDFAERYAYFAATDI